MTIFKAGDKVCYNEINLTDKGTVIAIGSTPRGGDVLVRWNAGPWSNLPRDNKCEECSFNLRLL